MLFSAGQQSESATCIHTAAAKSLQSCLTLCDPMDCSPPGSCIRWILQARALEWVAISFSRCTHISPFLKISFPFRSPQSTGLGSLCHRIGSHYAQVDFRQYLFVSENDKEELRSVINQWILFIQMSQSQVSLQVSSSYLWDFFLGW